MNLVLRIGGVAVLMGAMVQALRIGWADYLFHRDTAESVQQAIRIWPNDAGYEARLADLDERNAIAHLRRALTLDPGLSKSWIQLGLHLELEGRVDQAERCYLEAAGRDRQFLPAWTLANFYARRNDAADFWPWARQAAEMSYDDISPLLRLAFGFTSSPEAVMREMIVPKRKVEHEFLYYLINEKMDASPVAARLLAKASKEDLPPLLAWTDRLIRTAKISDARALWNALSDRRLLEYPHVEGVTNADFSKEPIDRGFDWRLTLPEGVSATRAGGALRIEFSGRQPENCELVSQYLGVTQGSYRLWFEYRTAGIAKSTGLRWWVGDAFSDPWPAAEEWRRGSWVFTAGRVNRLTLLEQRDPGATRPEGVVYLRGIRLESREESNG